MTYTELALAAVTLTVAVDLAVGRLLTRRAFWTAYGIMLFFQLITNGWLTGRGIVRYDAAAILGWRVVFAPVEDLLFGFALVLWTLECWVRLGRSSATGFPQFRLGRGHRRRPGAAGSGVRGQGDA